MKDVKTENTIKRLENTSNNANPELKQEIQEKINSLKSGKMIQK